MKKRLIDKATNWFLRFVQVQLLVSLVSLPILANWGFPISLLSPIGNILFTPIFTLFLLISSMIFFSELLCIPNGWLVYLLEQVTSGWLAIIPSCSNTVLIGFPKPPILFSILVPAATFAIIVSKKIDSCKKSIFFLFLLLIASFAYLKIINKPNKFVKQIPCNGGQITLLYQKGKSVVIDPGVIGKKASSETWIEYTLAPEITQACGSTTIDHLILLQPNSSLFEAIKKLCEIMHVKNLYIPYWQGEMKKNALRNYYAMKIAATSNNTKIKRISQKKEKIIISQNTNLSLSPLKEKISYHQAKFPAICITCMFDNQEITIYSTKSKKSFTREKK